MHQKILVLDFGSRFTQLIARCVRDAGVYCEIRHADFTQAELEHYKQQGLKGIILSGNDALSAGQEALALSDSVLNAGVPVLGIAYGMQALLEHEKAQWQVVTASSQADNESAEFVQANVRARGHTRLLNGIEDFQTDQGHGILQAGFPQSICVAATLSEGFVAMASLDDESIVGIANENHHIYALAFHPEIALTPQGSAVFTRFVRDICGCSGDWNMTDYIDEAIEKIRAQVGNDEVILGLSGGVDSSVAAALIHKAIGKQLTSVFVDHGLLRLNEADQVMKNLGDHFGMKIIHVDASEQFLGHLNGVSDPEEKRKIIGREFINVFQDHARNLPQVKWLAQGTIYPDVIESASTKGGNSVAVKSHHNVGGLPETLNLQLLEPLRELFKDEVRQLGISLGLPAQMVYRHPFPGPGLGVRILGAIQRSDADTLRLADAIFIEELRNSIDKETGNSWYDLVSQAFAVFLPVKSVGVGANGRVYEPVIALRAVQTTDFMTAAWAELPYSLLAQVSSRIIQEVKGVSRVVYDVSGKPPATIEWE